MSTALVKRDDKISCKSEEKNIRPNFSFGVDWNKPSPSKQVNLGKFVLNNRANVTITTAQEEPK